MNIYRYYGEKLKGLIEKGKVLVIYGPRQVGKTTLIEDFLKSYDGKVYAGSGDNSQLRDVMESQDFSRIVSYFDDYDLIFIDEAQRIENIGYGLKIIVDQLPEKYIIATGSSSFDLSNKVGEPLVGRQKVLKLYPIAMLELKKDFGTAFLLEELQNLLIYGGYPEVLTKKGIGAKEEYLSQIVDSYLYRDILELENIKNSKKILDLLRLIAFQIGNEVSLQEIGNSLNISKNTVERYLDLLEKSFVLINVRGYSGNLRKEITKTSRYYFYDNGVRNAVIGNFNHLDSRDDVGKLWENLMFIERLKKQEYHGMIVNNYFWRTWNQKEIDFVEEREGKLFGYEFKWKPKHTTPPDEWVDTYKQAEYEEINSSNFVKFVS